MLKNIIEINRQVELVQVLLYLSGRQKKTAQQLNNISYIKQILDYFSPYKNHYAVELTKMLIDNKNFVHIKPLRAILTIENILNDDNNILHSWASAVENFKNDTKFEQFFTSNYDYYNMIIQKIKSFGIDEWILFIEDYFHQSSSPFRFIICPINGNYGFSLDVPAPNTAYVVRCVPDYDESGNTIWREDFFAKSVAHEYAHCFVNPVVEANKERLPEIRRFLNKHDNIPKAYNVDYAVMNEYWVRAFAIRFMTKYKYAFPMFDMNSELEIQRSQFQFIDEFVELLNEYEIQNLTFKDFYTSSIEHIKILGK